MAAIISDNTYSTFFLARKHYFPRSFLTADVEAYESTMYVATDKKKPKH